MLSIDGVHLTNDLGVIVHADSIEEALPSTRDYSVTIPGRHGAYPFKSALQPRDISVTLVIPKKEDTTLLQAKVREITRLLVDSYGNPKEVELIYDFDPNLVYYAKYNGNIDYLRVANTGRLTLPFTAYDPYAYSRVFSDEVTWGSEEIFFTNTQYTLGHENIGVAGVDVSAPTSFGIYVTGYAVKPIIEVEGLANSLTIETGGQEIEFPPFNNAKWTIDCEKYLVKKNGNSAFGEVKLRNFVLNEGNNVISVSGANINVNIKVRFRDKFL